MYDERLVRKINQGRAFALLGSGPSNEVGYPSWSRLATEVLEELKRGGKLTDEASYQKYLTENRYPELLSQAERDSGSRSHLVGIISALLRPSPRSRGYIYEILANWPFCCYLTTNWDNEIDWHLRQKNLYFHTLLNGKEDLAQIRHDASQLIVKLHSDLSCEDRVVITSGDYANLMGTAGQYFRDKLKSIFEMFDVLVVGHSLSDPDLRLILQVARETASPEHPIFLIAADLTRSEVREYLERFNIVAMTYDNPDGKHSQLRRVLSLLDKFIIPRQKRFDLNAIRYSPEELEAVQAVALYRRLASAGESELSPILYLGPLILRALQDQTGVVSTSQLSTLSPLSLAIKTEGVQIQVPAALEALRKNGFIEEVGAGFKLSTAGLARAAEISQRRSTEEEQAYGQFSLDLQSLHCPISSAELSAMVHLLQDTLVKVFKQRGLSIANVIFAGQSLRHDALSDMFSAISSAATEIPTPDLGIAFMEASQKFLLNPTEPQKRYLTSTSQGFFLYHLFGLDPSCAKIRRDVFRHAIWWCDSSSLIPLLAQGSANYDYAVDLFTRLQKLSAYTLTTGRLVREVEEHLSWAIRLFENEPLQSPAVLEAATQKAGYKQNLFLDGYVRLSAEGKVSKFHDYIDLVAPYGPTEAGVRKRLGDMAVRVVNAD